MSTIAKRGTGSGPGARAKGPAGASAVRRRRYVVDAGRQRKMAGQYFAVVAAGAGLGLANYLAATRVLTIASPDPLERVLVFGYVALLAAISALLVYLLCNFFSHRVVGPAVKVAAALRRLAAGDLAVRVSLREGDQLHDVANGVNDASDAWRRTVSELRDEVEWLKSAVAGSPKLARRIARLEAILGRYRLPGT